MKNYLKGEFHLRERSIWNNVYAVYHEKIKWRFLFVFLGFVFLIVLIFISRMELKTIETFQGTYICEENCFIKTILPFETVKKLNTNHEIRIENFQEPLKILEFGEVEYLNDSPMAVQFMTFEIGEKDYFNFQTIEFQIVMNKESLFHTILRSMKGGE